MAGRAPGREERGSIGRILRSPGAHRILAFALIIGAWQFLSGRYISAYFISSPSDIATKIVTWARDGTIARHVTSTVLITICGFVLASALAIPLALWVSASKLVDAVLGPFIYAAYSMPKIVLGPALVLWLGIGLLPAIALSCITAFFLVFYNVYVGLKQVAPIHTISAKLLGATPLQAAMKFRLPAAGPFVATGLSQGLIYAFHGAMVGEITASNVGVGYLILFSGSRLDSTAVMAALVLIGLIALAITLLLDHTLGLLGTAKGAQAIA